MKNVIICNKEIGETPLECLERIRKENNMDENMPMTYAGRLDPMAEGLFIILSGEECKNKEKYTNLDKEYQMEILFGIKTDSYDILGLIENIRNTDSEINNNKNNTKNRKIEKIRDEKSIGKIDKINFKKYIGKFIQEYPRYSSKIIAMKDELIY